MLYPTLENGHEVLGQEYCPGYTDTLGNWNSGFYCPLIPDVPAFCCGTQVLKYCCIMGKPISGGYYSKAYGNRDKDVEEQEDEIEEAEVYTQLPPEVSVDNGEMLASYLSEKSLFIGVVCGLIAMATLMTIVICFYCSCCFLYKKRRRDNQLDGGGGALFYGITVSSSQVTNCGLRNSLNNHTAERSANAAMVSTLTSRDVGSANIFSNATSRLPNFITNSTTLNPLVDYLSNNSNSATGEGSGSSSTAIVATSVASLSPPNIAGGLHHQHIHGSVYHHHHHYTTSTSPITEPGGTLQSQLPSALDPPPPYLAFAGQSSQQSATNCYELLTDGTVSDRIPRRTNSRGSSSNNFRSRNANLEIHHQLFNNSNNIASGSHCSIFCSSPININNNVRTTTTNDLTRFLSSSGGGPSRGNLPPPYFVEQYRIRNRVRLPPFPTSSSRNRNHSSSISRTQETIQNLLYPLLNTAVMPTSSSLGSSMRAGAIASDTREESRSSLHRQLSDSHNNNRNTSEGTVLHRSSSERHQSCVGDDDNNGGSRRPGNFGNHSGRDEGAVVMTNNVINNLSTATSSSAGRAGHSMLPNTGRCGEGRVVMTVKSGGDDIRRTRSLSNGKIVNSQMGKILNTEVQRLHLQAGQSSSSSVGIRRDQITADIRQQQDFLQLRSKCQEQIDDSGDNRGRGTRLNCGYNEIVRANDDDDVIMPSEDEVDEEEMITAVTTTTRTTGQEDDIEDDIMEDVAVMGCIVGGSRCEEDNLVDEENSEGNSTGNLSKCASAPNISKSVSPVNPKH